MENISSTIAKNLIRLRKQNGLTQLEFAKKFNYSDKAVSKWENSTSIPSISILMQIAKFYNVNLEEILYEERENFAKNKSGKIKTSISLISTATVFLIATIVFVTLFYSNYKSQSWLSFVVALPIVFLLLTILFSIWRELILCGLFSSFFVWTTILSISLVFKSYNIWLVYIIGFPLQLIIIFSLLLIHLKKSKS